MASDPFDAVGYGNAMDKLKAEKAISEAGEPLESQTERLAQFIIEHVPGEPSESESAIDTAIRILRKHYPNPIHQFAMQKG